MQDFYATFKSKYKADDYPSRPIISVNGNVYDVIYKYQFYDPAEMRAFLQRHELKDITVKDCHIRGRIYG